MDDCSAAARMMSCMKVTGRNRGSNRGNLCGGVKKNKIGKKKVRRTIAREVPNCRIMKDKFSNLAIAMGMGTRLLILSRTMNMQKHMILKIQ